MAAGLPTHVVAVDELRSLIGRMFAAAGCVTEEAERVARFLVSANLAGHDSHGVIRVPRYIEWLGEGLVFAGKSISVVTETSTHAVVDGNVGLGQTIAMQAVDLGIGKAKAAGMAVIALRNSGHIGRIGDWAERAGDAGLVSIHFVNVAKSEIVAPFGGVDRRFGTNPVCIGIPGEAGKPMLLLDFATSMVAEGKVLVASNGGKPLPAGALIGPDGSLSTDPVTLYGPLESGQRNPGNGTGALRTFGDHKGSGLAFMCEILAGCFTGGGTAGPIVGKRGGITNGMLSFYMDPSHFGSQHFVREARAYADYVKEARPADPGGEVLLPGEPEARTRAIRLRDGIPLQIDTWAAIMRTAATLKVAGPA